MAQNRQEQPTQQPIQLQVEIEESIGQGVYANLAMVAHTGSEFVVDFIFVQPQSPKAKVRARIISSPGHTKRFLLALAENVSRYEQLFGEIKDPGGSLPDPGQCKVH